LREEENGLGEVLPKTSENKATVHVRFDRLRTSLVQARQAPIIDGDKW
jgi:hypothetical protein